MIKLHCDLCDEVIAESAPRVVFKHFPNQRAEISIEQVKLEQPDINVTVCENCLSHYTLADIVARFGRKKF